MNAGKYVIFEMNAEQYGLPIEAVEQILNRRPITRIPKTAKEVLGVFDLRGETLPVIDTSSLIGSGTSGGDWMLVVSLEDLKVALVADRVAGIVDIAETKIRPNTGLLGGEIETHTALAGEGLVVLLDPTRLLPRKKLAALKAVLPAVEAA